MSANYLVIGTESEKVRGIAFYAEGLEERDIERRKQQLCQAIVAGLLEIDQHEPLVFRSVDPELQSV